MKPTPREAKQIHEKYDRVVKHLIHEKYAIDKDAAFKTIAFKFFGGDSSKLDSYLQTFGQIVESIKSENTSREPQEVNEYRQLAMF